MPISNPGAVIAYSTLSVAETEVFSGTPPAAWTDLDLSAVVSSKSNLVRLKFSSLSTVINSVAVRKNGETDEFYMQAGTGGGCSLGDQQADGLWIVLEVETDTAGIIEWKAETQPADTKAKVIAHIGVP